MVEVLVGGAPATVGPVVEAEVANEIVVEAGEGVAPGDPVGEEWGVVRRVGRSLPLAAALPG